MLRYKKELIVVPAMILDIQGTVNTQRRQLTQISGDEVGEDGQREIPKEDAFQNET